MKFVYLSAALLAFTLFTYQGNAQDEPATKAKSKTEMKMRMKHKAKEATETSTAGTTFASKSLSSSAPDVRPSTSSP